MSRWLVTGAGGMLGRDLTALIDGTGEDCLKLGRTSLDITDPAAVRDALAGYRPDVVVNCAAWTAVDDAEAAEDAAFAVNGSAVAGIAAVCRELGISLVQVSTDYVFDGMARTPYAEDHLPAPRTAYGRTKLAGEHAVLTTLPGTGYVVRTAWLYGAHGHSFVGTMLGRAQAGVPSTVVNDQRGQPTWTVDVAAQIHALLEAGAPPGIYHATSSGEATWYDLAREVYRLADADPSLVQPVGTGAYPRPAPRPAYSVLGHDAWHRAGLKPIDDWLDSLGRALPAIMATESELTR
ncbi:MAG: dTDP-4-dehydrorhamnose reductase [Actinobacteria bacterium]|nr:dTDP-4-dehydrorhamnose reductase [Actinomycetota bacterium]